METWYRQLLMCFHHRYENMFVFGRVKSLTVAVCKTILIIELVFLYFADVRPSRTDVKSYTNSSIPWKSADPSSLRIWIWWHTKRWWNKCQQSFKSSVWLHIESLYVKKYSVYTLICSLRKVMFEICCLSEYYGQRKPRRKWRCIWCWYEECAQSSISCTEGQCCST